MYPGVYRGRYNPGGVYTSHTQVVYSPGSPPIPRWCIARVSLFPEVYARVSLFPEVYARVPYPVVYMPGYHTQWCTCPGTSLAPVVYARVPLLQRWYMPGYVHTSGCCMSGYVHTSGCCMPGYAPLFGRYARVCTTLWEIYRVYTSG